MSRHQRVLRFRQSTEASRGRSKSPEKQDPPDRVRVRASSPDFYTSSVEDNSSEAEATYTPTSAEINKSFEVPPLAKSFKAPSTPPTVETPPLVPVPRWTPSKEATEIPFSRSTGTAPPSEEMGQTKIRSFKGLRDGKEDPMEYIEDIEWAYEQDFKAKEPRDLTSPNNPPQAPTIAYYNKTHRILFRQNLESDAFEWYSDLDGDLKQDWPRLLAAFLPAFAITAKDAQTKKFELRIKLANLEQLETENIADYLKKADELAIRLPNDYIDVGMATLKGMRDTSKRERVSFECGKDADYTYATVTRLIKAAYTEVGKANPFDPGYKDSMRVTLPGVTKLSNEELMRQVLINTNQAFPALVQGMRALHTANTKGVTIKQPNTNQVQTYPPRNPDRPRRSLSEIKCFVCDEYGHYASDHNKQTAPPQVTAGVFTQQHQQQEHDQQEQYYEQDEGLEDEQQPTASRCLFIDDQTTPAMAAARPKGNPPQKILQRPQAGVQKDKAKGKPYNPPVLPQHILDQITEYNENNAGEGPVDSAEDMEDIEEESAENTFGRENTSPYDPTSPPYESSPIGTAGPPAAPAASRRPLQPVGQNSQRPPQTRTTKTGKVQELVAKQGPKQLDPIRGMVTSKRFDINQVLSLPIQLSLGELLDRSDQTIKELAYNMQRATPRYRVRKTAAAPQGAAKAPANQATLAAAAMLPPHVTAFAYEDDGQSKPVMIMSWIHNTKLSRTLLDNGSLVELISRKKLNQLIPPPKIYTNGYLKVSLATDKLDTLTDYTIIPVNVQGVEATVKAWVVDVDIYDLLLGLSWMRRVHCNPHYGSGNVTITGDDSKERKVPAQLVPITAELPTVELNDDEDSADLACQYLLDEQEKGQL